jgi:hypothetical protein
MTIGKHGIYLLSSAIKPHSVSSQEFELTDHQTSILRRHVARFRAADTNRREKIITEAAGKLKNDWREGVEFDNEVVISVREPSSEVKPGLVLTDNSSLFATTCTAKLNGDLKNWYLRPENGLTLML